MSEAGEAATSPPPNPDNANKLKPGSGRPRSGHKRGASSVSMQDSPLQQMNAEGAQSFRPKVLKLYEQLFTLESHPPGYWVEFFLLPVHKAELSRTLKGAEPLAEHRVVIQTLVQASIANLSGPGRSRPQVELALNAIGVLEVVFVETLTRATSTTPAQGTSPISLLVGLDRASKTLDDLTAGLLAIIQHGPLVLARSASEFVLHVSGATLGTNMTTLFNTKNFFAALMRVIDEFVDDGAAMSAFTAIGALCALNMYGDDGANVYLQRTSDFIDEAVMTKIVALVQNSGIAGSASSPESLSSSATPGGLVGAWLSRWISRQPSPSTPSSPGEGKSEDRPQKNSIFWPALLPLYMFIVHNSLFASTFSQSPALISLIERGTKTLQYAHKTHEIYGYAWLSILIMRHLVETQLDALLDPAAAAVIRLESPKLVFDSSRRVPLSGIVDSLQCALKSNAGKRVATDWALYDQLISVLYQVCAGLAATKTIWVYNWPQLWRTLLGLLSHFAKSPNHDRKAAAVIQQTLRIVAGMAVRRDLLEEDDWASLLHLIVQTPQLFADLESAFPEIAKTPALSAIKAMAAQFELNPKTPDFAVIVRQGEKAAGGSRQLIGEKLAQFSETRESALLNRVFKTTIKSTTAVEYV